MFPFPFSFVAPTASGLADIDNVYSMDFDGVDDYIDLGSGLDYFDYTNNGYSVSFWMKTTGTTWYQKILNFGSIYNGGAPASGVTQIYSYVPTAGAVNDGNWHHIVLTVPLNVTGTEATIYVDNSTAGSGSSYGIAPVAANSISDSSKPYEGLLDEVAIFNYALDAGQVEEIYNATSVGKTADLSSMATPPVAWYRMGD